jgi:hypothetical protein
MSSAIQLAVEFLRRHRALRALAVIFAVPLFAVAVWVYFGVHIFPDWWHDRFHIFTEQITQVLLIVISVCGATLTLCLLSFSELASVKLSGLEIELQPIRKEREEIRHRIEHETGGPNVFDTIQLGLNQITEYYTINKGQARRSFVFSVFSSAAGLLTLIGGIWLFYFRKTPNLQLATLSGIGGILLQFIDGASFYIYNKSLSQLNYFYDKLVRMQDTMLAIQLSSSLKDESRQQALQERLIVEILTRQGVVRNIPLPGQETEPSINASVAATNTSRPPSKKKNAESKGPVVLRDQSSA